MFSKKLQQKNIFTATILAFVLVPLSGIATDIFIPSLPGMVKDLHTTEAIIRLSITAFLLSYGISQFISGALIDAFGRQRLNLLALLILGISSTAIAFTNSVQLLIAARIVQGLCAGTIATAKRTLIVDLYIGEKLKHYLSIMSIVWSIGPIVAPFIGGYLDHFFSWRASFYFLAAYAFIILFLEIIFSGETIRYYHDFRIGKIAINAREMLSDRSFLFGIFLLALSYGMVILFGLSAPFILQHRMGYTAVFTGYISLIMGFAWMCGGFLGKALIKKEFFRKISVANYIQMAVLALMIGTAVVLGNVYTLITFAFLVHVCAGFIFNNYFAFCLGRFPKMAGLSGGLTGGLNYMLCSVFSYGIVWAINPKSQSELGAAYLILSAMMTAILFYLRRKSKQTEQKPALRN